MLVGLDMRSCGGARSHGLLIVVFLVGHAVDAVVAAGNRSERAEVSVVCGSISAAGSSRGRGGAVRGCVFLACKTVATVRVNLFVVLPPGDGPRASAITRTRRDGPCL